MNLFKDGECQFRSSHEEPIYLQALSPNLLLVLELSLLFSIYIYTQKKNN